MIRVVHPGSRIRMLTFYHPGSRIQGSKRHPIPDPGSGSATLTCSTLFNGRKTNTLFNSGHPKLIGSTFCKTNLQGIGKKIYHMKLEKVMIGKGTLRKNRLIIKKENCIEHMDRFLASSALTKEEKGFCGSVIT
jgi:hypothetical protein